MRRNAFWIVAVTTLGLAIAPATIAVGATSPFSGTWVSIDTDGSHQTMSFSGSGNGALAVRYYDDVASVCGGSPARFAGVGQVDGDTVTARVLLVCLPGGHVFGHIPVEATYNAGDDTLSDPSGVVWTRK
jgi:hypothetical protein